MCASCRCSCHASSCRRGSLGELSESLLLLLRSLVELRVSLLDLALAVSKRPLEAAVELNDGGLELLQI